MKRISLAAALLLSISAALAALPPALAAQTAAGELVDADGAPVAGALVALVDSGGRVADSGLSDARGRFRLAAPAAGAYRLRAERVGFGTTWSAALRLEAGAVVEHRMVVEGRPVALEGVVATARSRCVVRPGSGPETAVLWEEARKALQSVAQARDRRLYRFTAHHFVRDVDAASGRVEAEQTWSSDLFGEHPFTAAPRERLMERGFVEMLGDSVVFHAPDAGVLLSDEFLDGHCFHVVQGEGDDEGLVGLAFERVRDADVVGVRGTLWLHRASAELRYLQFAYDGLRASGPSAGQAGGAMEFLRLPSGGWIVSQWSIRAPLLALRRDRPNVPADGDRPVVIGFRDRGGEVTAVRTSAGVPVHMVPILQAASSGSPAVAAPEPAAPAPAAAADASPPAPEAAPTGAAVTEVVGTVVDADGGRPISGATVRVAGAASGRTTDREGTFALGRMAAGEHTLEVTHPRYGTRVVKLRVAGGPAARVEVRLQRGTVELAPLVVSARTLTPHEMELRAMGSRVRQVSREQIERHEGSAMHLGDVLRAIPGMRVGELRFPRSSIVRGVVLGYHGKPVEVLLDRNHIDPETFRRLKPHDIESMEFYPNGYGAYGLQHGGGVLLLWSRGRGPTMQRPVRPQQPDTTTRDTSLRER